jgi:hypothetical protein
VIPLVSDPILEMDPEKTLSWLNKAPAVKDLDEIRKALRHSQFSLPSRRGGEFVHHLEINRI